MMFLSERRRLELIESLTALTMPYETARRCASHSDNLARLDRILGDIVGRLGERVHRLRQAALCGNEDDRRLHDAYLRADLAIYVAYQDEILARRLPGMMFPKTTRAVEASREQVERSREWILQAMGKKAGQPLQ